MVFEMDLSTFQFSFRRFVTEMAPKITFFLLQDERTRRRFFFIF